MNLSIEQFRTLEKGEPVRVTESGLECVILRADVYDRIKTVLDCESPLSPDERTQLLIEAGKRAGWDDPEMDVYNEPVP
jgi:hypothetical protein